jgi:hypothetical protein
MYRSYEGDDDEKSAKIEEEKHQYEWQRRLS